MELQPLEPSSPGEAQRAARAATLGRYFDAVTSKDIDKVLDVFDKDAVIETSSGNHAGHAAIANFYRTGVFKLDNFRPQPGKLYHSDDGIAVEIALHGGGAVRTVGDFFTIQGGKITRMAVFSGPGYSPEAGATAGEGSRR